MITCEAARELLLDAEPAELRGEGEGALAAHLRECAACRQRAAFLLAETQRLQSTLQAIRPPLHAVERGSGGEAHRWRLLVPLALAAGLGALLLARRHEGSAPGAAPLQVAAAAPGALDVQVPAGQTVAVFQTANPNIVVIWSYRTGRQ
jgi:hypothetical protein